MRHFILSSELNDDCVESLQELFNIVGELECELTVYIDSNGGYIAWGETLIKVLNSKYKLITLVGGPELSSAALLVWLAFKGRKDVMVGMSSTAHMGSVRTVLRDGNPLDHNDSKQDSLTMGRFSMPLVKKLLTEKQLVSYKLGLDVLVPYNQLKKYAIAHNKTL